MIRRLCFRFSFFLFLFYSVVSFCGEKDFSVNDFSSDELVYREISSRIILGDFRGALDQVLSAIKERPESFLLQKALVKVYASENKDKSAIKAWKDCVKKFPEYWDEEEALLEEVAWSVIKRGAESSSSLSVRLHALIAAILVRDAYSVEIVREAMRSSNSLLRSMALQLSYAFRDWEIQEEILRLLRDPVWHVRLEAIKAAGRLQIVEALKNIENIISDERSDFEEKSAAVGSMLAICKTIPSANIEYLSSSKRFGLRLLVCELVAFLDLRETLPRIQSLQEDAHAQVRASVWKANGLLRGDILPISSFEILSDPDPIVSAAAAWFLVISGKMEAKKAFSFIISHNDPKVRNLASAALAATGKYGINYMKELFDEADDLYVKANLGIGLLGQQVYLEAVCDAFFSLLEEEKGRLMFSDYVNGLFRAIDRSEIRQVEGLENYPEAVNQMVRLEILHALAITSYPKAVQALRDFLKRKNWEVTGLAAELLLKEGDESIFDLMRSLCKEEDPQIRVQAALALSIWAKDQSFIGTLQNSYQEADRDLKAKILEALGYVGGKKSIPFLVEKLEEPFQTLRIIAASSIVRSINH